MTDTHKVLSILDTLKLALEALDYAGYLTEPEGDFGCNCLICQATAAVKEALAQPEQRSVSEHLEPVAYGMWDSMIGCGGRMMYVRLDKGQDGCTVPLYTTPPQRKPLTDEQIWEAYMKAPVDIDCHISDLHKFARAIEAAHGIKE